MRGFETTTQVSTLNDRKWIDGLPGYVSLYNGTLQTTSFEIEAGCITAIYKMRNPDKLTHISGQIAAIR